MREMKIEPRQTNRTEDSLYRYLNDLGNAGPLKPEEEVILAERIREGDSKALDRLVRANLKFVVSVAKKYAHVSIPLNDLINEGNIGLIRAAKSFDETKGFKFISYAVWYIRSSIFMAFGDYLRTIRIPMNQIKAVSDARIREEALLQQLEREPTLEELAEIMDIRPELLANSMRFDRPVLSMDAPGSEESELDRWAMVADENAEMPDEQLHQENLSLELDRLLEILPKQERAILRDAYGFGIDFALDFEQIGPKYGKTPTWARQLNRKAIQTLKAYARPDLVEFIS